MDLIPTAFPTTRLSLQILGRRLRQRDFGRVQFTDYNANTQYEYQAEARHYDVAQSNAVLLYHGNMDNIEETTARQRIHRFPWTRFGTMTTLSHQENTGRRHGDGSGKQYHR